MDLQARLWLLRSKVQLLRMIVLILIIICLFNIAYNIEAYVLLCHTFLWQHHIDFSDCNNIGR